jgi:alpha-L-arabinofuranosidase
MMKKYVLALSACALLNLGPQLILGQKAEKIQVQANKPTAEVNPAMWGVFFEDINFAADGGLYAELVKNRSFEFAVPMMGWKEAKIDKASGKILIINRGEANAQNPRFARVAKYTETGSYGLFNEGFRGMSVEGGKQYNFSVLARSFGEGQPTMRIELTRTTGEKLGEATLSGFTSEWNKYTVSIKCSDTEAKARLYVLLEGVGTLDLDMISLFPQDTWKNRPNGLRADLVQWLYDLKPGFVRFPGGCIVEGRDLANRYEWKKTVGNVENRELIINRWNTEFAKRSTPDYFQSFGLGFYEYFQLSEDIGAEPLPILNCGMACQYNTGEVVPMEQLGPYIQDMLDLIEFANGPVTSKWGKLRADMGHPASFNLKMVGVGNEQWEDQYVERYKIFHKILKEKHPEITLVTSSGPDPDGGKFKYAWTELSKLNADIIDEHYYRPVEWFLSNASRYDSYDRKGLKVFAGEYACHVKGDKAPESRNNWEAALCEAAFMTGLERNADIVRMASYAPLFANLNAWQWNPDCIWFDGLKSFATPNYYVQKMYATNKGTNVVPILRNGQVMSGKDSLYASAVIDKKNNLVIMKIANVSTRPLAFEVSVIGASVDGSKPALVQTMSSSDVNVYNSLENPVKIAPVESKIKASSKIKLPVAGRSFIVVTVPCKKLE